MGVECCWKAYWCGGKAGSAAASIIIVLHSNTICLHDRLILALFCCIKGPAYFLPLVKNQTLLLDLGCSKMNFPLFSFCGWLKTGELCELTNCTTFLNVCACLVMQVWECLKEPLDGWNWLYCTWQKVYCISTFRHSLGVFSEVIEVERWSQTLPVTFVLLIYHPLPLQLYTHTLTVRCGLSSRLQFQSWSVLQQQSRGCTVDPP